MNRQGDGKPGDKFMERIISAIPFKRDLYLNYLNFS